jgi:Fic family protein
LTSRVATIADEAIGAAGELSKTVQADRERMLRLKTTSVAALRLFDALPDHPIVTAKTAMHLLRASKPTAGRAIDLLVAAKVLVERSGRRRDRRYAYGRYVDLLRDGTE